jgi:hypothetical protein
MHVAGVPENRLSRLAAVGRDLPDDAASRKLDRELALSATWSHSMIRFAFPEPVVRNISLGAAYLLVIRWRVAPTRRSAVARHRVLILLATLSVLTYVDRVCISVAGPQDAE